MEDETTKNVLNYIGKKHPGKNKLLICSDSHGRNIAWNINNIQNSFEAVGYVKPGGGSEQVLSTLNFDKEKIKNEDVLVLMCGANDVAKNEAQRAVSNITKTLEKLKRYNANVILVDLPTRLT
uniref:SGNH hydrolase-type esterase domain-containing protein n=1 Tax=Graphocephala atropunctata TaxID=36148 RepID=A0A1B6MUX1_9HEMI